MNSYLWRAWLLPDSTSMHEYSTNMGFIGREWGSVTEPSMQIVRGLDR